jgi:hypothetical protein
LVLVVGVAAATRVLAPRRSKPKVN